MVKADLKSCKNEEAGAVKNLSKIDTKIEKAKKDMAVSAEKIKNDLSAKKKKQIDQPPLSEQRAIIRTIFDIESDTHRYHLASRIASLFV